MQYDEIQQLVEKLPWDRRLELAQFLLETLSRPEPPARKSTIVSQTSGEVFPEPLLDASAHALDSALCPPPSERKIEIEGLEFESESLEAMEESPPSLGPAMSPDSSISESFQKLREALASNVEPGRDN